MPTPIQSPVHSVSTSDLLILMGNPQVRDMLPTARRLASAFPAQTARLMNAMSLECGLATPAQIAAALYSVNAIDYENFKFIVENGFVFDINPSYQESEHMPAVNPNPERELVHCADCESECIDENFNTLQGRLICLDCCDNNYVYSSVQEAYIPLREAHRLYDGEYVTNAYRRNHCYVSSNGEYWFSDGYDRDQYDEENEVSNAVFSYHSTNPQEQHGGWPTETPRNSLCFGVELEMEHKDDDSYHGQQALSEALGGNAGKAREFGKGRYILMSDGSLSDSGVELITQPYTLDFHQKTFGWKPMLESIASMGKSGKGTSNCGMHVHVNRRALSALNLGKLLVFVNADKNGELVKRIAQRDPSEWAALYPKKVTDGAKRSTDKYEACHLSEKTVEFRIFRGNLRPDRVLKNIEFCHAAIIYSKDASMRDLDTPTGFVAWLGKNRGTYPNLVKFLADSKFAKRMHADNFATQEEI